MKLLPKILAVLLFAFSLFAGTAKAQEATEAWIISPPPTFELDQPQLLRYDASVIPGAQFYTLRAGDRAPVAGILLNAEANAWLIAQYEFIQRFWITEMNRRVQLTLNWGNAEVAGLRVRSETDLNALNLRVETLEQENNILNRTTQHLIQQNRRQRILYRFLLSGSAIAVVAATASTIVVVTK